MIKNSLKYFATNILYLFVAMGIIYLFLIIAAFVFVTSTIQNLSETISSVCSLVNTSAEQSSVSVQEFLTYSFGKIDWNGNFFDTLNQVFSTGWLTETMTGFFETLNSTAGDFGNRLTEIIDDFRGAMVANLSIAAVTLFVGLNFANFTTKYVVRRRNAKRNFKKMIIAHTLVPIFQSLILSAFFILFPLISGYSFLVVFILLVFLGFVSLMGSWLIYREGGLKLRQVLTTKNIMQHVCVILIILLINVAADLILFIISPLLAVLFMVPFAIYSFAINDVNTDVFVRSLINSQNGGQEKINEKFASEKEPEIEKEPENKKEHKGRKKARKQKRM